MPRTIFWGHFLEALQRVSARFPNANDLLIPAEDIACETNWPAFGNPDAAYVRGGAHEFGSGKNINGYLDRIVEVARNNATKRLLLVNMHPFFRVPLFLRSIENIYIADGNLAGFERALNLRTIRLPALPISTGVPSDLASRDVLASFQGVDSHPIRRKLASIADGKRIVVRLVERGNHSGKINALTKATDKLYEGLLSNSIFAFVPRGDANFSYRLLEVMSFGCIPVILSDGWVLPFDRVLPWSTFSLSFSADAVPLIPDVLGSLSDDEIASRFKRVQSIYATHFKDLDCIVTTLFNDLDLV